MRGKGNWNNHFQDNEVIDISDEDEFPPQRGRSNISARELRDVHLRPVRPEEYSDSDSRDEQGKIDFNDPLFMPYLLKRTGHLSPLHLECLEYVSVLEPYPQEIQVRNDIVAQITHYIKERYPDASVSVFGSFASGSYLPHGYVHSLLEVSSLITSDIDLTVHSTVAFKKNLLYKLSYHLKGRRVCFETNVIATAKVPLIKIIHHPTRIPVDISFNTGFTGENSTAIVTQLINIFQMLRPMLLILKIYLFQQQLNDPSVGGLGGYSLCLMIVSFLQSYKYTHRSNEADLGELLLRFFEFYGKFDYDDAVICITGPNTTKYAKGWTNERTPYGLAIEDPAYPSNNVGKSTFQIRQIKAHFLRTYGTLESAMGLARRNQNRQYNPSQYSILGSILRPIGDILAFRKHVIETSLRGSFFSQRQAPNQNHNQNTNRPTPNNNNNNNSRNNKGYNTYSSTLQDETPFYGADTQAYQRHDSFLKRIEDPMHEVASKYEQSKKEQQNKVLVEQEKTEANARIDYDKKILAKDKKDKEKKKEKKSKKRRKKDSSSSADEVRSKKTKRKELGDSDGSITLNKKFKF